MRKGRMCSDMALFELSRWPNSPLHAAAVMQRLQQATPPLRLLRRCCVNRAHQRLSFATKKQALQEEHAPKVELAWPIPKANLHIRLFNTKNHAAPQNHGRPILVFISSL